MNNAKGYTMAQIKLEKVDHTIARVVIDQEERYNALTTDMWAQLTKIMIRLDAESQLRCVILTGAGDRAFSSGADISEFRATRSTAEKARRYGELAHATLDAIRNCRHPVVAEIHGLCIGGGLEVALCADIRIAGRGSRFGIPAKRLGLVVAYDELRGLVDTVGPSNALRVLLEGEIFGAEEAIRLGLVNRLVDDRQIAAEASATALRIAEGAPLVARWHKKFVQRLMDPRPLAEPETDECYDCFGTQDFHIGYSAFLAKTKPSFVGR